jgi:hypothetical protein
MGAVNRNTAANLGGRVGLDPQDLPFPYSDNQATKPADKFPTNIFPSQQTPAKGGNFRVNVETENNDFGNPKLKVNPQIDSRVSLSGNATFDNDESKVLVEGGAAIAVQVTPNIKFGVNTTFTPGDQQEWVHRANVSFNHGDFSIAQEKPTNAPGGSASIGWQQGDTNVSLGITTKPSGEQQVTLEGKANF